MAGHHIGVLALICICLLVLPSWSENSTNNDNNDNQLTNEEQNAGEPTGKTRIMGKKYKKIKNRNKKEKKLEKKWKRTNKNKTISTRVGPCPTGWSSLATGCYKFPPIEDWMKPVSGYTGVQATFDQARAQCKKEGGYVVEITSQKENDALKQFEAEHSKNTGIRGGVWLGLTDRAKEGEWIWSHSGEKMTYNGFKYPPDNIGGNEDCVMAIGYFDWNDDNCDDLRPYVGYKVLCEYTAPACTGTTSDWSCCSSSSPCQEKQGDCDSDSDCAGSLVCGKDNCKDYNPLAHSVADCCITKPGTGGTADWGFCSSTSPCKEKQGDCDSNSDCAGSLVCGNNNCKDFHPSAQSAADCCIKKMGTGGPSDWGFCSSTSPCKERQGDCDFDSDCAGSLVCGNNNCKDFHPLAESLADCCIRKQGTGGTSDWEFCSATSLCQEKQGDCDSDSDCAGSLVCGLDNCKDFHPLAQSLADCCIKGCGIENTNGKRISGGSETAPNQYPWMVRLPGCGGSLITNQHVLTAKHCVDKKSWQGRKAKVSVHRLDDPNDYKEVPIKEVVCPGGDCEAITADHDIAIVILDQAVDLNDKTIGTVCLPSSANEDYRGEKTLAIGWGWTPVKEDQYGKYGQSKFLQDLEVEVAQKQEKNWLYTKVPFKNGIPLDVCRGDSGGPLVHKKAGQWTIIGTVNSGASCSWHNGQEDGRQGKWNKVTDHLAWIKSVIGN